MEALGVMVEVIFCLVVDGVLESRPGLLHPSASPGLRHRWPGMHAVSPPLHPGTDHRARSKTDVGTFLFQELLISGLAGDVVANDSLRRCALAYFVDGRSSRNTSAKSFANC